MTAFFSLHRSASAEPVLGFGSLAAALSVADQLTSTTWVIRDREGRIVARAAA